jgi:hypothetical protein
MVLDTGQGYKFNIFWVLWRRQEPASPRALATVSPHMVWQNPSDRIQTSQGDDSNFFSHLGQMDFAGGC